MQLARCACSWLGSATTVALLEWDGDRAGRRQEWLNGVARRANAVLDGMFQIATAPPMFPRHEAGPRGPAPGRLKDRRGPLTQCRGGMVRSALRLLRDGKYGLLWIDEARPRPCWRRKNEAAQTGSGHQSPNLPDRQLRDREAGSRRGQASKTAPPRSRVKAEPSQAGET
jgi:hypothetical protein